MQRCRRKTSSEKQEPIKIYGRVEIINTEYKNSKNFEINSIVVGSEPYKTYVSIHDGEVEDITCNCQDYYNHYGVCKHTLASVMEFAEQENQQSKKESRNS